MFKINLSSFSKYTEMVMKIKENEVFFDENISINELDINLTLTRDTDDKVIIQGKINGKLNTICARCLEKFILPIKTEFVAIFKKKEMADKIDNEEGIYVYEKNEIDLFNYIRETLLLELPIKPLCNSDCKGLCPVCGKNLNKEKCNCKKEFKNTPFYNLNIKKKEKEE